jgi:hypothetical protein
MHSCLTKHETPRAAWRRQRAQPFTSSIILIKGKSKINVVRWLSRSGRMASDHGYSCLEELRLPRGYDRSLKDIQTVEGFGSMSGIFCVHAGAIWPCPVRFGPARCDLALPGAIRPCPVRFGPARCDLALPGAIRPCPVRFGLARCDSALPGCDSALPGASWPCPVRFGLARCDSALPGAIWPCPNRFGPARWTRTLKVHCLHVEPFRKRRTSN